MTKKFELWLDESGDFENDGNKVQKGYNPSLVGGLLIERQTFPDSFVNYILPEEGTYHSVINYDTIERFKLIEEKLFRKDTNRLVVFSNQECVMILDNNLTYLNIIVEGILQLLKQLKAEFGDIFLEVVIANRVDTTTGLPPENSVVDTEEYIKRLRERILIEGIEKNISDKEWNLLNASARKDKRLMLADIVCNTFLTRNGKKFSEEEKLYIENIYNDKSKTIIFTVFESVLEKNFKSNLIENRIGEAVANVCLSKNSKMVDRCFGLLKRNFRARGVEDIAFQYRFIKAYIDYYINVSRDFDLSLVFLNNLLSYYVELLYGYNTIYSINYAKNLSIDIKFYILTVYTHLGNYYEAKKTEEEIDQEISSLPLSFETVDYRIRYDIRKLNNIINAFNYKLALSKADELVKKCRDIKEYLSIITNEEDTLYQELGKALGTRIQIKTFLLRFDKGLYDSSICDFNEALENYTKYEDKKRLYNCRVQLETEHGDYDKALECLKLSIGDDPDISIKEIWEKARKNSFSVSAFTRVMAEGAKNGWKYSDDMFEVMDKSYIEEITSEDHISHPYEIILWKYASYCSYKNMEKAGEKYYERAGDYCYLDTNNITLNIIGLAIDFEWHSFMLRNNSSKMNSHLRSMQKRWNRIKDNDYDGILENVFENVDFKTKEAEYYMNLSKKVTY